MSTTEGPEDVGGLWAVCTHPGFQRQGIAAHLLDEAHVRMRAAGLRFSTLGTSRHRVAHMLYRQQGYVDLAASASAVARRHIALRDTRFRAQHAGLEELHLVDEFFRQAAAGFLGFSRRHLPFLPALVEIGDVNPSTVWLLWDGERLVGYALAELSGGVLTVTDLLLREGSDAAVAIAALAEASPADYVRVSLTRSSYLASLQRAGYQLAPQDWGAFMLKPLTEEVTVDDAVRLFGIGTDRFMMSWLDVT